MEVFNAWATRSTLIGVRANARQHHITHPASLSIDALRQLCGSKVFYRTDDCGLPIQYMKVQLI